MGDIYVCSVICSSSNMFEKLPFLICLFVFSSANEVEQKKDSRQFSLFSIVTFKNDECSATSTSGLKGVCMTSTECSSVGTADGNCASAFGVCCIIKTSTCGGSVTKNSSYIENPSYPSSYSTTGDCSFTVTRCSTEICQVRLDMFKVVLQQPASATGSCKTPTQPLPLEPQGILRIVNHQHCVVLSPTNIYTLILADPHQPLQQSNLHLPLQVIIIGGSRSLKFHAGAQAEHHQVVSNTLQELETQ